MRSVSLKQACKFLAKNILIIGIIALLVYLYYVYYITEEGFQTSGFCTDPQLVAFATATKTAASRQAANTRCKTVTRNPGAEAVVSGGKTYCLSACSRVNKSWYSSPTTDSPTCRKMRGTTQNANDPIQASRITNTQFRYDC